MSLIEILIAMLLLALMAVAVIPLLIVPVKASLSNRATVAATTFANATLESLRAEFPLDEESSCMAVRAKENPSLSDPAGTGLKASVSAGACPTTLPDTVTVTVEVADPGTGPLVTLATEIMVTTA
ncbi:MAG: hypothetical protein QM628_06910 [Propionicimonas sp.]